MENINKDEVVEVTPQSEAAVQENEIMTENENSGEDEMIDDDHKNPDENSEDLMDMYAASFKQFEEGEVVIGKIISIDKDHVLVDIGYKSEGRIRIVEFKDEKGNINAEVDDSIEVMVELWDDEEEVVILSKEKAEKIKVWEAIKKVYDSEEIIEGVIQNRVKGGFSVDIGVHAFLPGSQADLKPIKNLDEMVGKTFEFKILKYNQKRSNIVLSRRVILEAERDSKRSTTLEKIEEGQVLEGIVKNITEYGVFIDLGGVDGLLHITDISWGRVKHPSEFFSVGDQINVKILSFDREKERVSLGMKQLAPDPWTVATEKYPLGSKVMGRVVSLTDYGAFVELEEGIEGLIHVSEMSWTRKIRHPSKLVSIGEEVEAIVLDIKPDNRRISLGIKQVAPNPWDVINEKYPIGTTIEGRIKNITDFGLFIGIDEGIDGLVHISDISWIKRIKHPSEIFKKGETVQAIVLDIDKGSERFSLGIKQLQPDPWGSVASRYEVGKKMTGTITNITDFGIFVELEEGIEGLIHVSEISKEKIKTPVGMFNLNDPITAKVMNINSDERRIGLSLKRLEMEDDKEILSDYLNNIGPATSSFGEILRENLQEKLNGGATKKEDDEDQSSEPEAEAASSDDTAVVDKETPVEDPEKTEETTETADAVEPEKAEETAETADAVVPEKVEETVETADAVEPEPEVVEDTVETAGADEPEVVEDTIETAGADEPETVDTEATETEAVETKAAETKDSTDDVKPADSESPVEEDKNKDE